MSLQGTIVPGRLGSELYPWGVKMVNIPIYIPESTHSSIFEISKK